MDERHTSNQADLLQNSDNIDKKEEVTISALVFSAPGVRLSNKGVRMSADTLREINQMIFKCKPWFTALFRRNFYWVTISDEQITVLVDTPDETTASELLAKIANTLASLHKAAQEEKLDEFLSMFDVRNKRNCSYALAAAHEKGISLGHISDGQIEEIAMLPSRLIAAHFKKVSDLRKGNLDQVTIPLGPADGRDSIGAEPSSVKIQPESGTLDHPISGKKDSDKRDVLLQTKKSLVLARTGSYSMDRHGRAKLLPNIEIRSLEIQEAVPLPPT